MSTNIPAQLLDDIDAMMAEQRADHSAHVQETAADIDHRKLLREQIERSAQIDRAIAHLRLARDELAKANAPRTLARVRAALTSADGARRHAHLAPIREKRRSAK